MKIEIVDNKAYLTPPYNPDFVRAIKSIGGARWVGARKAGRIPAEAVDEAREIMRDIYGEDDFGGEKVTARLSVTTDITSDYRKPIVVFGRSVISAISRDGGCIIGDGVSIVCDGEQPSSGGSAKNYYAQVPEGAKITLYNIPKSAINDDLPRGIELVSVETNQINRAALVEERERLMARIAAIDEALKEADA